MGLDISIVKFISFTDKGYLNMGYVEEDKWDSDRYRIRHDISKNIDFDVLSSGKKYDMEEYYRPSNFAEAYLWAETLEDGDKEYIKNILNILQTNINYYLEYGY